MSICQEIRMRPSRLARVIARKGVFSWPGDLSLLCYRRVGGSAL